MGIGIFEAPDEVVGHRLDAVGVFEFALDCLDESTSTYSATLRVPRLAWGPRPVRSALDCRIAGHSEPAPPCQVFEMEHLTSTELFRLEHLSRIAIL